MTDMPARASAVVIGAGIVGNSLVHHLALLGWRDVVLLDKGPLPNPGGSTGHASNFIFPIEYSRLMFELTRDSTEQYKALGVFTESGGIEVARTRERMQELRRRTTQAKAWGIPAEILTPEGVQKLVPYLDPSVILGGGYFPTVGVVDSLRAGTLMREQAQAAGALTVISGAEVLEITVAAERVTGVVTSEGEIATENVVICCGVWSPKVAALAGARLALTPAVHQMISVGPIGLFAGTTGEISYPIVRDVDEGMYERQHGGDMEVGSYMHRPIIVPPETIPSNDEAVLSPTELPFTADDFDPQLAASLDLMPALLGETPEAKGLWAAAASWIKEGPGCGRAVAELMSGRVPTVDVHEAAVSRFYPSSRTTGFARARAAESFNKMYGIVHPAEQYESERPLRTGPLYERARELGAVFRETARWERPHWYASNEPLLATYAGRLMERPAEWDSRWWSPIINAEHLAMRDGAGLVDLSAFTILDVTGPGALAGLQRIAVAQLDVPAGRTVYTPFLNQAGRFVADLTIMRLGGTHFRVVTGAADGGRDAQWISDRLPDDAQLVDVTSAWSTIGLWGPRARDVLAGANRDGDRSRPGPFGMIESFELGGAAVLASRISDVGEFGWELHVPAEQAGHLWDLLLAAGG